MQNMKDKMIELQIGSIAKDILMRRMKELSDLRPDEFETKEIASFEKYTKLYLSIMEDWRKNFDEDLKRVESMKKILKPL